MYQKFTSLFVKKMLKRIDTGIARLKKVIYAGLLSFFFLNSIIYVMNNKIAFVLFYESAG